MNFYDASGLEWKYAGWLTLPSVDLHEDLSLTTRDEEQQKDVPVDYAMVKKTGDFLMLLDKVGLLEKPMNIPTGCQAVSIGWQSPGRLPTGFLFMADGIIAEEGKSQNILNHPQNPGTQSFLKSVLAKS